MKKFLFIGFGCVASHLSKILINKFNKIIIFSRTNPNIPQCEWQDIYNINHIDPNITHILITLPPHEEERLTYNLISLKIAKLKKLNWTGYLSSTSIYGDYQGAWVDENSAPCTKTITGKNRINSENMWANLKIANGNKLNIFRLAAIYGHSRSIIEKLLEGNVQRIKKKNHFFSRIHVSDIIGVLLCSIKNKDSGEIYNLADDEPAENSQVIAFACTLMGLPLLPEIEFKDGKLSSKMLEFYSENKRISNNKIKLKLGYKLQYPSFREGLKKIWEEHCDRKIKGYN